jgi:hypothetical protein
MWPEISADLRRKSSKPAHSGRAFLNQIAIDERLRGGGSSNGAKPMTVLFLIALGFLAVLAYGTLALGFAHVAFERLARKQHRARQ